MTPKTCRMGDCTFDLQRRELVFDDGRRWPLPTALYDALCLFASRSFQEVSRAELGRVGGRNHKPTSRAIDAVVHRVRIAIEDDMENPQLIRTAFGRGYIFTPLPPGRKTTDSTTAA